MIKQQNDNKGTILHVKSKDVVSLTDMLNGINFLKQNTKLTRELRIIEDAKDSTITFTMADIPTLTNEIEEVSKHYKSIRHAVIHNSPCNTAMAMFIKLKSKNNIYQIQIFSTKENAQIWLNSL